MTTTETKIETISFSQVQTYLTCPLRYQLQYYDDLEPEFTTDSLLLGSVIHETLEVAMKCFRLEGKMMKISRIEEVFCDALNRELNRKPVEWSEGWHPEKLRRVGLSALSFWRTSIIKDIDTISEVVAVEERFSLDAISPDTGHFIPRKISGCIDLVLKMQRGIQGDRKNWSYPSFNGYLLIDHKTAAQKLSDFRVDRDMQLSLYQWAAAETGLIPDRDLTAVGFSLLKKTQKPAYHLYLSRRSEHQERQALKLISRVVDAIDMELFYPNISHIHCKSCPYKESFCIEW